jgi:ribosome biogenesis protein MAK21
VNDVAKEEAKEDAKADAAANGKDDKKKKKKPSFKGKGKFKGKKGSKKGEEEKAAKAVADSMSSKLLGALLTGVNRAFPYAQLDSGIYDEQLDSLFRVVHQGTFNTAIQALLLLHQVMAARSAVSARFYRALYDKLLSPDLLHSSKHALFLNLLYKTIKVGERLHPSVFI